MSDEVWVSGAYNEYEKKPARGGWLCPSIGICEVTKKTQAISMADGLRVGCAMAILSAINCLGEDLVIHVPSYPPPRWLVNSNHAVPLPNLLYRLLYKLEVHSRIRSGKIRMVVDERSAYGNQISNLLFKGEVPKGCIL